MNYRFLIYISYSYSLPIGEPLEEEIAKRGYEVMWFADEDEGKKSLALKSNIIDSVQELIDYKADVVLVATNDVPDFINGLKVQVFHGFLSHKRPSNDSQIDTHFRIRGFFDLYCTQGPSTTLVFKKLSAKYKYFEVVETGFSKMDPLFKNPTEKKNQLPTIMIASTFTKKMSLAYNDEVFNEIKKLSECGKYMFKMVLHPKHPIEIVEKWKTLENDFFNFSDTTFLIPIFKECDIMFADTTSAIQEFLLQKKPVVAFNHKLSHPYLLHVNNTKDIESTFKAAFNPPDALLNEISDFILELHPYFDGKSSKRVVDASLEYLRKDKSNLFPKPINLIRKIKIRKKLGYPIWKNLIS